MPCTGFGLSDGVVGGVVGALATGIVGYVLETGKRCVRLRSLCLGLATELETLWNQHMKNCGDELMRTPTGEIWMGYYPVYSEYFINYHANAADLGELRDAELRSRVVATYSGLKGFVDSFQVYNKMFDAPPPPDDRTSIPGNTILGTALKANSLRKYTGQLMTANAEFELSIPALVKQLRDTADFL